MVQGIHRPDPNPSCIQVSHSFLTAESWGFPAARPGGRTQDAVLIRTANEGWFRPSIAVSVLAGPKLLSQSPRSNLLRLHLRRHRAIVGQIRPNIAEIPAPTRSLKPLNPELKLLFMKQTKRFKTHPPSGTRVRAPKNN